VSHAPRAEPCWDLSRAPSILFCALIFVVLRGETRYPPGIHVSPFQRIFFYLSSVNFCSPGDGPAACSAAPGYSLDAGALRARSAEPGNQYSSELVELDRHRTGASGIKPGVCK